METPEQFAKSIQVTSKYTRTLLLTLGRIHALLGNQCNVSCKQKTPSQGPIRVKAYLTEHRNGCGKTM